MARSLRVAARHSYRSSFIRSGSARRSASADRAGSTDGIVVKGSIGSSNVAFDARNTRNLCWFHEARRSHKPIAAARSRIEATWRRTSLHVRFDRARRGQDDSDVDLFFDYEKGKLGLFELMDVKACAARFLGRSADIMTRDSLHKMLRQKIEATAVRVF
jgi:predicted nucleotidyltransferase